jgi:hypothetical protein
MIERTQGTVEPLPVDALLLSVEEAAGHLRMTAGAFRKFLETDPSDFATMVRGWLVVLSPRRRYIKRDALLSYLRTMCGQQAG